MTSPNRKFAPAGAGVVAFMLTMAAAAQTATPTGAPGGGHRTGSAGREGMMMEMCPERVPGTQARVVDVPNGIAVEFSTDQPKQVAELRRRLERLARMHEEHRIGAGMHGRMMNGSDERKPTAGCMHGMGPMMDATTRVEEIPSGGRLVVTAASEGDVEQLREHVRIHVERMEKRECPMQMMMTDERPKTPPAEIEER